MFRTVKFIYISISFKISKYAWKDSIWFSKNESLCLKSINNKIIKDKHIKSVLVGLDGSSVKSIAFNCVENEIGAYLLKKDKKLFNIAGKLSLNEWQGQSNVEFIIDDISVNKTLKNTVPSSIG